jgi:hypothetical protein
VRPTTINVPVAVPKGPVSAKYVAELQAITAVIKHNSNVAERDDIEVP